MSLFSRFNNSKRSTAFSIDNGTLRYISVMRQKEGIQVVGYGSDPMGALVINSDDQIIDDAAFVSRLRVLVSNVELDPKNPEINVVIPDQQAVMFHTHISKESSREMGDVIVDHIKTYCEANNLLQFADYICEYDIILETSFGYDVHVTLVPKRYVEHLARLFKQAGIAVRHVETAHHAVAQACLGIPTGTGIVLVSFGTHKSTVALLNGNHLVSQEVVSVGAEHLYDAIVRFLGVDHAYAEKIIARHGILKTHPDNGLLGELYLALAPIYRSVDSQLIAIGREPYKMYGHRFTTDTLVVYGEGLFVRGLAAFLGEKTNLEIREIDVWASHADQRAPVLNLPAHETLTYAEPLSLALLYLDVRR